MLTLLTVIWGSRDTAWKWLERVFWMIMGLLLTGAFVVALVAGVEYEVQEEVPIQALDQGFEYIVHQTGEKGVFNQEYIIPAQGTLTQQWMESGARAGGSHYAWDIASSRIYEPVRAFAEGEVVSIQDNILQNTTLRWRFCGNSGVCWYRESTPRDIQVGYGNVVILKHPENLYTLYAHLETVDVSLGQTVPMGATIGAMGSTGFSTGKHLHFEILTIQDGKRYHIDPKWAFGE